MKIGGFFALQSPEPVVMHSVFDRWGLSHTPHVAFSNGRSALHFTLRTLRPATVWLPSYCCDSLAQAVDGIGAALNYYKVDAHLSPDMASFSPLPGDTVLVIDYFGHPPSADFLAFVRERPDIHWIEDRAQAFSPASTPWGDYVLYSPRKLLGVGDGGVIASATKPLPPVPTQRTPDPDPHHPATLRARDVREQDNAHWHTANQQFEGSQRVENSGISAASLHLLKHTDARLIAARRRENYDFLQQELGDFALLPAEGDFVPLGFPIRTDQRIRLAAKLAALGIFAAHHWPHLPSPADRFPEAHALAQQLLTLPCDQRYDLRDMQRIVTGFRRCL